jgi:hypothetical protein
VGGENVGIAPAQSKIGHNVETRRILKLERLTTKALIALACSLLLAVTVSTVSAQERVLEGTKEGVQKGVEGVKKGAETAADKAEDVGEAVGKGVKKGAETAVDKTEDVGEAVGKGVKDVFTDDDPDSDNDEGISKGVQTTEPQQQNRPAASATESDTDRLELPATAGEQPLILLIAAMALAGAAVLKVFRRVLNS